MARILIDFVAVNHFPLKCSMFRDFNEWNFLVKLHLRKVCKSFKIADMCACVQRNQRRRATNVRSTVFHRRSTNVTTYMSGGYVQEEVKKRLTMCVLLSLQDIDQIILRSPPPLLPNAYFLLNQLKRTFVKKPLKVGETRSLEVPWKSASNLKLTYRRISTNLDSNHKQQLTPKQVSSNQISSACYEMNSTCCKEVKIGRRCCSLMLKWFSFPFLIRFPIHTQHTNDDDD